MTDGTKFVELMGADGLLRYVNVRAVGMVTFDEDDSAYHVWMLAGINFQVDEEQGRTLLFALGLDLVPLEGEEVVSLGVVRTVNITINGNEHDVTMNSETMTYEDLVALVDVGPKPTVTCRGKDAQMPMLSLIPGGSVRITPGMVFNIADTGGA